MLGKGGENEMALGGNRGAEELSTKVRSRMQLACCKVELFGGGSGSGSLCRIGDVLCVLTNNHVMSSEAEAATAKAVFTCMEEEETCSVHFDPTKLFFTDKLLDYAFVAVREMPKLGSRDLTPVILGTEALKPDDYVYIVQYPRGQGRKDSYGSVNEVQKEGKQHEYVYHSVDTDYGSSGGARYRPVSTVISPDTPTHVGIGVGRPRREPDASSCSRIADASLSPPLTLSLISPWLGWARPARYYPTWSSY
jgi:hypothetical protein